MIRRLLWFIVGFLLAAVFTIANAETIPATSSAVQPKDGFVVSGRNVWGDTALLACQHVSASGYLNAIGNCYYSGGYIGPVVAGKSCYNSAGTQTNCGTELTCPAGQNWTLTGSQCIRPDCVAPQTRQSDGTCKQICPASELGNFWYSHVKGAPPWGTFCVSGCEKVVSGPIMDSANPNGEYYYSGNVVTERGKESMTGGTCSAGSSSPPPSLSGGNQPPTPPKKPPCAAGEGVLTTSTGQVRCVPAGTPSAEKPRVGTSTSVDKKSDGSTATNTTTTTCSGEGACSSTTTTTITGAGGGSTPGAAGTPGTSTKDTDSSGAVGGAGGAGEGCDPSKQMCSKPDAEGLYTKKDVKIDAPLKTFADGVRASALGQNTGGFFTVSVPSGSCPQWSTSVNVLNRTFSVDLRPYFCTQQALDMMNVIGNVLMVVAAFGAFRWAIL